MAIESGFFNSINRDRVYDARSFAQYFASFIGNGVFPNPSTGLQVTAGTNLNTVVKAGKGWINGYYISNDSDYVLQHDIADGVLKRVDRIVMRLDYLTRTIDLYVKKGAFASNPVGANLQRDSEAYELSLADVYIDNGSLQISQSNITDTRLNNNLCGIVSGVVEQVDTTTLFDQYQSWISQQEVAFESELIEYSNLQKSNFEEFQRDRQEVFDAWFANIQDALSGDVAANLTNRVQKLEADLPEGLQMLEVNKADKSEIGQLYDLETINKNNLVSAINEVKQSGDNVKTNLVGALLSVDPSLQINQDSTWPVITEQVGNIETGAQIEGQTEQIVQYTQNFRKGDRIRAVENFATNYDSDFVNAGTISGIPNGFGRAVVLSPDSNYMAGGFSVTPFIRFYKRSGDNFSNLTDPTTLPGGPVRHLAVSADGIYYSATHSNGSLISVYKRVGDTFSKLANLPNIPTGDLLKSTFSPDGVHLAITSTSTPFLTIYRRSGDTFTKLANPSKLPPGASDGVAFNNEGSKLAIGHSNGVGITIYNVIGSVFSEAVHNISTPEATNIKFSADGKYLAISYSSNPYFSIYSINGDNYTRLANPILPITQNITSLDFSPDSKYLAFGSYSSPNLFIFKLENDEFVLIGGQSSFGGPIFGLSFSRLNGYLGISSEQNPHLTVYKSTGENVTKVYPLDEINQNSLLSSSWIGYANEDGLQNENKKTTLLWRVNQ